MATAATSSAEHTSMTPSGFTGGPATARTAPSASSATA